MELLRALAALADPPSAETAPLAGLLDLGEPPTREEYSDLFLFQLYPYASVYLGAEGMLGGEARDRIGGFWRALELEPPLEPDHLATLLAFYAELARQSDRTADDRARAGALQARRAFLHEHLLSWLPVYLARLATLAGDFYRRWGNLLAQTLSAETLLAHPLERLPLHLREAPGFPAPESAGGDEFLAALLAPVRSGVILVRADLARAARELDIGARIGERRFVLRALLAQEPGAVLGWLQGEAARQSSALLASATMPAPIREFWTTRAENTSKRLAVARSAL